jgi:hypothetical protein
MCEIFKVLREMGEMKPLIRPQHHPIRLKRAWEKGSSLQAFYPRLMGYIFYTQPAE